MNKNESKEIYDKEKGEGNTEQKMAILTEYIVDLCTITITAMKKRYEQLELENKMLKDENKMLKDENSTLKSSHN